ncbi:hypothetical protein JSO59_003860 [Riemerella anatipestifer]|uniref:hypothetical protein n=1 Tax=Riemerella anatipestifer TaxID=34085 RepID=UPI0030BAC528
MDTSIMNREIILPKPKIGEPCNGCGICCHIQLCNTGAFLLKKSKTFGGKIVKGKCPALLSEEDGTFSCGLIKKPKLFIRSKYNSNVISRTVATLVGVGSGCDEIGEVSEDVMEEIALQKMIENKKNDRDWISKVQEAYELLLKF